MIWLIAAGIAAGVIVLGAGAWWLITLAVESVRVRVRVSQPGRRAVRRR